MGGREGREKNKTGGVWGRRLLISVVLRFSAALSENNPAGRYIYSP